jgi:hypothetical protein
MKIGAGNVGTGIAKHLVRSGLCASCACWRTSRPARWSSGVMASARFSVAWPRALMPSGALSRMPRWYQRFSQLVRPLQMARPLAIDLALLRQNVVDLQAFGIGFRLRVVGQPELARSAGIIGIVSARHI